MSLRRTILRGGAIALVHLLGACTTVLDIRALADAGTRDGVADDGSTPEGMPGADAAYDVRAEGGDAEAAAPCTDDMAFVAVEPITELGRTSSVRFVAKGTIAFVSSRGAAGTQDDIAEGPFPIGGATYLSVVATSDDDTHPAPLADRLSLFYELDAGGGARAVGLATRPVTGVAFGTPTVLPIALDAGGVQTREPYAIADGNILYFTMDPGAVGGRDIYRAARSGGTWSVSLVGGAVSTGSGESHPVVAEDELTLYFARGPIGGRDVYIARRTIPTAPFDAADPLSGIGGGSSDDRPSWLSPDHCVLFFTSDRDTGNYGAYRARRR